MKEPFNFSYILCFVLSLRYRVPDSTTLKMPRVVSSEGTCAGALHGLLQRVLVLDLVLARLASTLSERGGKEKFYQGLQHSGGVDSTVPTAGVIP